tara:strand:- start:492 stop:1154 length:663 start_codon:yes stop_codon:yes gene_type:complete
MSNLTLIIPTKFEAESLPIFLEELNKFKFKKIVVLEKDDIITQKAISKFQDVQLLVQKFNGYGNALIEGIQATKTEYCCIINADGSMDPKYLEDMLIKCKNIDFVFASRYLRNAGSEDDNIVTIIGNKIFTLLGNIFFKLEISDILYTYILGKSESFKNLNLSYKDFRICVEIPIKVKKKKFNYNSIPSYERKRIGGKKKVNAIKDGLLILFAMVRLFFK